MNFEDFFPWSAAIARLRLEMILAHDRYSVEEISSRRFEAVLGRKPIQDDLARCNCEKAGQPGHYSCGWDTINNVPFFMSSRLNRKDNSQPASLGQLLRQHFADRIIDAPLAKYEARDLLGHPRLKDSCNGPTYDYSSEPKEGQDR